MLWKYSQPSSAASRAEAWVVHAALMRVVTSPLWRASGRMVVSGIFQILLYGGADA